MKCMNMVKTTLNTCSKCLKGPTSKENRHFKQNSIKKIDKN